MKTAGITYSKELETITIHLYTTQVWNEAIEAAALKVNDYGNHLEIFGLLEQVRKLKK